MLALNLMYSRKSVLTQRSELENLIESGQQMRHIKSFGDIPLRHAERPVGKKMIQDEPENVSGLICNQI